MLPPDRESRLAEMVRMGIPQETADAGRTVLEAFGGVGWSIFAQLDEDPPILELVQFETGLAIRVEILPRQNEP